MICGVLCIFIDKMLFFFMKKRNLLRSKKVILIGLINFLVFELGGRFMDFGFIFFFNVYICYRYFFVYIIFYIILKGE